jgi:regulator of cell morphogenesis and NO signaling
MEALAAAVARRFGEERPQLTEIAAEIAHVRVEIEWHLRKEELVLFPLCRKLEQDHAARTWQSPGTAGAIGVLIAEHDEFTAALLRLRELSSDFAPAGASLSHRALLDALEIFDRDMQVHLRKEDEMLFPRAIGLQLLLASCRHRRKAGRGIGESRNTE